MKKYVIKLENGKYMKYDQIDSYELMIEETDSIQYAETFSTYESANEFAKCINNRKDGEYRILSYEDAICVLEVNSNGELVRKLDLEYSIPSNETITVDVLKSSYAGQTNWVEECYIQSKDGKLFDDIFDKYEGKTLKLTIEVVG